MVAKVQHTFAVVELVTSRVVQQCTLSTNALCPDKHATALSVQGRQRTGQQMPFEQLQLLLPAGRLVTHALALTLEGVGAWSC